MYNSKEKRKMRLQKASTPSSFLKTLVPTRKILALVFASPKDRSDERSARVGAAVSDPYLSFATPVEEKLPTRSLRSWFPKIVIQEDVGGVLLIARPLVQSSCSYVSTPANKAMEVLLNLDLGTPSTPSTLTCIESDVSKSLEEVIEEHKVNPLWDTMNFEDLFSPEGQLRSMEEKGVASMQASIGLQLFLDEHCGGWQNTFG